MKPKSILALRSSFGGSSLALASAIAAMLGSQSADATALTWLGNSSANLADAANYTAGTPALSNTFTFGAAGSAGTALNNDLGGTFTGMTFQNPSAAYTISGGSFIWGGNITNSNTAPSGIVETINSDLDNGGTTRVVTGAGGVVLGGIISGAGGITKQGGGTSATLTNANTFTGQVFLQNGGFIASSLNSVVGGTASSNLGAPTTLANGTIKFGTGSTSGTLTYNGSGEITDRVIELSTNTGASGITQSGTGLLKFTSDLTSTGAGSKTLTLGNTMAGSGELAGAIVDNSGTNITSIVKSGAGAGSWTLSGINTYSGTTQIQEGTFNASSLNSVVGGSASSSLGAPTTVANGTITLGFSTTSSGATLNYTGSGETTDRVINLTGNTLSTISQSGTGLLKFTSDLTSTSLNNRTLILSGSTAGTGEIAGVVGNADATRNTALRKSGSGTWTLSGANTYRSSTAINQGTLIVSSLNSVVAGSASSSLGTPNNAVNGTIAMSANGSSKLVYTGSGETTDRIVATSGLLASSATIDQSGTGLLKFTGDFSVSSANNRNLILTGSTAGTGEIAGVISNAIGPYQTQLNKNGTGAWTLSGANTYTGPTVINAGTLTLDTTGQLTFRTGATSGAGNNSISGAGTVVLNGSFVIDTSATDASALTSGSWQIENVDSLITAYGASFTVIGWTDAGSDTWTKTEGTKNYSFDELTGTVTLSSAADAYTTWITSFEPNALLPDANSKLPSADPDGDGINNLLEFTLGGSPVVSSQSIMPVEAVDATNIVLTFKRSTVSAPPVTTQSVQISTDLADWTSIPPIPIGASSSLPEVLITPQAGYDDVTVTIPRAGSPKKFIRLNVEK